MSMPCLVRSERSPHQSPVSLSRVQMLSGPVVASLVAGSAPQASDSAPSAPASSSWTAPRLKPRSRLASPSAGSNRNDRFDRLVRSPDGGRGSCASALMTRTQAMTERRCASERPHHDLVAHGPVALTTAMELLHLLQDPSDGGGLWRGRSPLIYLPDEAVSRCPRASPTLKLAGLLISILISVECVLDDGPTSTPSSCPELARGEAPPYWCGTACSDSKASPIVNERGLLARRVFLERLRGIRRPHPAADTGSTRDR